MTTTPPLLTLLTDFGARDYYVAAVKGTVLGLAPGTTIVDLSHDISPSDIEEAAFVLSAAAPSFPPSTLHLAVVDPGVGSERGIVLLENDTGSFLAPDNGLLTHEIARTGAIAIAVDRPDLALPSPGATFHGRDRFAPIAAALLRGEPFERFGPPLPAPVLLPIPAPRQSPGLLSGRVAHIDRFGNVVTDIPAAWLGAAQVRVEIGAHGTDRGATHYAALAPGEAAWIVGSLGTVEVSLRGADLAAAWSVRRGASVRVLLG
jgi:S-adenosylmethionine hydrolase